MARKWWDEHRDQSIALLVFAGLALPLVPVPGDGLTRVEVRFQAAGMSRPHSFSVETKRSTCEIAAALLTYDNPDTGEYRQISCAE